MFVTGRCIRNAQVERGGSVVVEVGGDSCGGRGRLLLLLLLLLLHILCAVKQILDCAQRAPKH